MIISKYIKRIIRGITYTVMFSAVASLVLAVVGKSDTGYSVSSIVEVEKLYATHVCAASDSDDSDAGDSGSDSSSDSGC